MTAAITKIVFGPTRDALRLIDGAWQADITRSDGTHETVYRNSMPASSDSRMAAAGLYYAGRNGRINTYTWRRDSMRLPAKPMAMDWRIATEIDF